MKTSLAAFRQTIESMARVVMILKHVRPLRRRKRAHKQHNYHRRQQKVAAAAAAAVARHIQLIKVVIAHRLTKKNACDEQRYVIRQRLEPARLRQAVTRQQKAKAEVHRHSGSIQGLCAKLPRHGGSCTQPPEEDRKKHDFDVLVDALVDSAEHSRERAAARPPEHKVHGGPQQGDACPPTPTCQYGDKARRSSSASASSSSEESHTVISAHNGCIKNKLRADGRFTFIVQPRWF